MSKTFSIRQLIDCSAQEFWERIFRCEVFNEYLYDGLGFEYELQEWNPDIGFRKAKVSPGQKMPKPIAKVLGERFSYVEEGSFDADAAQYVFRVIPSAMPDRIRADGVVVVEAVSEVQCERKVTVEFAANVPGLSRLIEAYLVASTREQYAKNAALVNEYLAGFR